MEGRLTSLAVVAIVQGFTLLRRRPRRASERRRLRRRLDFLALVADRRTVWYEQPRGGVRCAVDGCEREVWKAIVTAHGGFGYSSGHCSEREARREARRRAYLRRTLLNPNAATWPKRRQALPLPPQFCEEHKPVEAL